MFLELSACATVIPCVAAKDPILDEQRGKIRGKQPDKTVNLMAQMRKRP